MKRWSYGGCFGGLMIDCDGDSMALIEIGPHARRAPSTGYKIARRMVRLLNAGEAALSSSLDASVLSPQGSDSAPAPDEN